MCRFGLSEVLFLLSVLTIYSSLTFFPLLISKFPFVSQPDLCSHEHLYHFCLIFLYIIRAGLCLLKMTKTTRNLRTTRKATMKAAPTKAAGRPQKAKPTIAGQPRPGGDGDGDGLSDNASEVRTSAASLARSTFRGFNITADFFVSRLHDARG